MTNTIPDEYWAWTPPLPGGGFGAQVSLQQPWLGIATIGGSRFGVPQLRGQDYEVPFASGQTWRAKWANSRTITLVMWTAGVDQSSGNPSQTPILAWNLNWNAIRRSFYARGPNGSLQGQLNRRWLLSQGPLLVESLWVPKVGGGTATTASVTVQAGDVLVVKGISRDSAQVIATPTDTFGLSWTQQSVQTPGVGFCYVSIWTATVPAAADNTALTISAVLAGQDFTIVAEQWRNCTVATSASASNHGTAGAPSVSVTPPVAGCYITLANGDHNSVSGTPAYRDSASETVRDVLSSHYIGYYANSPQGAVAVNVGMTAPATQNWALCAVVLQPATQIVTATALAEVGGTMDPTMTGRTRSDFSVDLLLSDPYFYGSQQSQFLFPGVVNQAVNIGEAAVAEGKFSIVNPWTCVLNGPLTTPIIIVNSTLGVTFELAATIGAGHLVTVDFLNGTAVDDLGNNLIASVSHAGSRQWLMLGPGSNSLELTSGSGSDTGYAALTWAPGYV